MTAPIAPAATPLADDRRFAEILERAGERARREKGAAGFVPLSNP